MRTRNRFFFQLGISDNLRWETVREGFSVFCQKNNNSNLDGELLELLSHDECLRRESTGPTAQRREDVEKARRSDKLKWS
jgi:hypothetical protein